MGGVLLLSGCASDDETVDADTPAQTEEASTPAGTPTEEPTEATDPESEAPAPSANEQTEVQIGEALADPDTGDSVEIISAIRDFPSQEQADLIADGGEVVLLQVKIAPGDEYGGRISAGNFKISWDEGADYWGNKTRMVEEEMDEADFAPLEDISRRDGGQHTGWIAFFADERAETYLVQYERSEAKVIGSDETIDAFVVDVEIPAP